MKFALHRIRFRVRLEIALAGIGWIFSMSAVSQATATNLYFSDYPIPFGPGSVYMATPTGVITTVGNNWDTPLGLAFDSSGDLFVADRSAGAIDEVKPNGQQLTFASGAFPPAQPICLAIAPNGVLYASDSGNVYKFSSTGVPSVFANGLFYPQGLAFDSKGDLFIANSGGSTGRLRHIG